MCGYSLHAVATRPAEVGETIVTTNFRGTSTRGFASAADPSVAVCLLPGTELAFADDVRYDNRWIWTRTINSRVGKFGKIDPHVPDRHHDAIELPSPAVAGEMVWFAPANPSGRTDPLRCSAPSDQSSACKSVSAGVASLMRGAVAFGARLPSKSPSPAPTGNQGRLVPLALTA